MAAVVDMSDPENYRVLLSRTQDLPEPHEASPREASTPHEAFDEPDRSDGLPSLEFVRVEVQPNPDRKGDVGYLDVVERFAARVDELGASVAAVATRLRASLESRLVEERTDRWQMSQVVVEFGLNLEAQTGVIVCQGKTAAAFKVAVTWTDRRPDAAIPPP